MSVWFWRKPGRSGLSSTVLIRRRGSRDFQLNCSAGAYCIVSRCVLPLARQKSLSIAAWQKRAALFGERRICSRWPPRQASRDSYT